MSGFSSKCLINVKNIIGDIDVFRAFLKSDREQTIKELTEQCVDYLVPEQDGGGDRLNGYCAQADWYVDADKVIIGLENQEDLIAFAESMKGAAKEVAKDLINSAGIIWSASVSETIDAIEADSLKSSMVCHAFEILDNCVNTDCRAMYFRDGSYWVAWPAEYEVQKIKDNPEDWAVIELLFK